MPRSREADPSGTLENRNNRAFEELLRGAANTARTIRRFGADPVPAGKFTPHRGSELVCAQAAHALRITGTALQHDGQRGTPCLGPKRATRRVEHRRPDTLQQVPQLLHGALASVVSAARRAPR